MNKGGGEGGWGVFENKRDSGVLDNCLRFWGRRGDERKDGEEMELV